MSDTIKSILQDKALMKKAGELEDGALANFLGEEGFTLTENDLDELRLELASQREGALDEGDLEAVAGGQYVIRPRPN